MINNIPTITHDEHRKIKSLANRPTLSDWIVAISVFLLVDLAIYTILVFIIGIFGS